MFQSHRQAPTGITITLESSESLPRRVDIGIAVRKVAFADHRSGWGGLMLDINLCLWSWSFCVLRWRLDYARATVTWITLADQIRRDHGVKSVMVRDDSGR